MSRQQWGGHTFFSDPGSAGSHTHLSSSFPRLPCSFLPLSFPSSSSWYSRCKPPLLSCPLEALIVITQSGTGFQCTVGPSLLVLNPKIQVIVVWNIFKYLLLPQLYCVIYLYRIYIVVGIIRDQRWLTPAEGICSCYANVLYEELVCALVLVFLGVPSQLWGQQGMTPLHLCVLSTYHTVLWYWMYSDELPDGC